MQWMGGFYSQTQTQTENQTQKITRKHTQYDYIEKWVWKLASQKYRAENKKYASDQLRRRARHVVCVVKCQTHWRRQRDRRRKRVWPFDWLADWRKSDAQHPLVRMRHRSEIVRLCAKPQCESCSHLTIQLLHIYIFTVEICSILSDISWPRYIYNSYICICTHSRRAHSD